jgi:hypothetical protein
MTAGASGQLGVLADLVRRFDLASLVPALRACEALSGGFGRKRLLGRVACQGAELPANAWQATVAALLFAPQGLAMDEPSCLPTCHIQSVGGQGLCQRSPSWQKTPLGNPAWGGRRAN